LKSFFISESIERHKKIFKEVKILFKTHKREMVQILIFIYIAFKEAGEMNLNVKINHAELLPENVDIFMKEIKSREKDTWNDDSQTGMIYGVLEHIKFLGTQHLATLKQTGEIDFDLTSRLKDLAKILYNFLKYDDTDTLYTYLSYFNTVYSGVMALEW
jgi:hypothetical protein